MAAGHGLSDWGCELTAERNLSASPATTALHTCRDYTHTFVGRREEGAPGAAVNQTYLLHRNESLRALQVEVSRRTACVNTSSFNASGDGSWTNTSRCRDVLTYAAWADARGRSCTDLQVAGLSRAACGGAVDGYGVSAAKVCCGCSGGLRANVRAVLLLEHDSCVRCRKGRFERNGSCVDCAVDSYGEPPPEGVTACERCPPGRVTPGAGSDERAACAACPVGKYRDNTTLGVCRNCTAGRFQAHPAQEHCELCPAGRGVRSAGAGQCARCPTGSRSYADGRCGLCPRDQFAERPGSAACAPCPDGTVATAGAAARARCAFDSGNFLLLLRVAAGLAPPTIVNLKYRHPVVSVAMGGAHVAFIDAVGALYLYGANDRGQLGTGNRVPRALGDQRSQGAAMLRPSGVAAVALGAESSAFILAADGSLWLFGANLSSAVATVGNVSDGAILVPSRLALPFRTVQVALSATHGALIDDSQRLWVWGSNEHGQLGDNSSLPIVCAEPRSAAASSCAALPPRDAYNYEQPVALCTGGMHHIHVPPVPNGTAGGTFSCAARATGGWGVPQSSSDCSATSPLFATRRSMFASPSAGSYECFFACSQCVDSARAAGKQLPPGAADRWGALQPRRSDAPLHVASGVASVSLGAAHTAYVDAASGRVHTAGRNDAGQLCAGSGAPAAGRRAFAPVPGFANASSLAAGASHTVFTLRGGAAYSCGSNSMGELGIGTFDGRRHPTAARVRLLLANASAVAAGARTSALLDARGRLFRFGAAVISGGRAAAVGTPMLQNAVGRVLPADNAMALHTQELAVLAPRVCHQGSSLSADRAGCVFCPAGRYAAAANSLTSCAVCTPGKYQDSAGATSCKACAEGATSYRGNAACFEDAPCAAHQALNTNGDCVCAAGAYNASSGPLRCFSFEYKDPTEEEDLAAAAAAAAATGGKLRCLPCPDGCSVCRRDDTDLVVQPKYGVSLRSGRQGLPLRLVRGERALFGCPAPGACLGEASADGISSSAVRCAAGHVPPLCARCAAGWERDAHSLRCERCGAAFVHWNRILPLVAVFGLLEWIGARWRRSGNTRLETNFLLASFVKTLTTTSTLKILLSSFQVAFVLRAVYRAPLPPAFAALLNALSFLEVDLPAMLGLECWAQPGRAFLYSFALSALLAGGALATLALGWKLQRSDGTTKEVQQHHGSALSQRALFALFLLYPPACRRAFSVLDCHALNDDEAWLRADYEVDCNALWMYAWRLAALAFIGLVAVGLPAFYYLTLRYAARSTEGDEYSGKIRTRKGKLR